MRLEYQILTAVAVDLVLGDPRWLPHPVRGIGRLAVWLEDASRRLAGATRTGRPAGGACHVYPGWRGNVGCASPGGRDPSMGGRCGFDLRHLHDHCRSRPGPAQHGGLSAFGGRRPRRGPPAGRRRSSAATRSSLDEAGVVRAAVESVAESTVDGVTAPLFFAVVAGPVGAMVYGR